MSPPQPAATRAEGWQERTAAGSRRARTRPSAAPSGRRGAPRGGPAERPGDRPGSRSRTCRPRRRPSRSGLTPRPARRSRGSATPPARAHRPRARGGPPDQPSIASCSCSRAPCRVAKSSRGDRRRTGRMVLLEATVRALDGSDPSATVSACGAPSGGSCWSRSRSPSGSRRSAPSGSHRRSPAATPGTTSRPGSGSTPATRCTRFRPATARSSSCRRTCHG